MWKLRKHQTDYGRGPKRWYIELSLINWLLLAHALNPFWWIRQWRVGAFKKRSPVKWPLRRVGPSEFMSKDQSDFDTD